MDQTQHAAVRYPAKQRRSNLVEIDNAAILRRNRKDLILIRVFCPLCK